MTDIVFRVNKSKLRVKQISEEDLEDLKFAQKCDIMIERAEKRGFKPRDFDEFMKILES